MMLNREKAARTVALLYIFALLFFVWGVAVGNYKIFPWKQVSAVYKELEAYFSFVEGPTKSAKDLIVLDHQERRTKFDFLGFQLRDPDFRDTGYLLISRYSKIHSQVIVELFSIANEKVLYTWIPPLSEIFKKSPDFSEESNTKKTYQATHPLLLKDGGLIFTSGDGPLVRIDACGSLDWIINRIFSHSIELDHRGNIVVVSEIKGRNPALLPMDDDGFAIVSLDGEILEEYSVIDILLQNGYRDLIYGVGRFEHDRIHLNDAQPILKNLGVAEIGDFVLSVRNLSTVLLFQPQSGKIKWLKTGPWLNQHDVNQLDDGEYSIFGNDIIRGPENRSILIEKDMSNIYVFDPKGGSVTLPYFQVMKEEQIATKKEGRSKILANGDAFIEETGKSRLIRISEIGVRWEYVNSISANTVGAIHWARYISKDEIDLKWMESLQCN